MSHTAAEPTAVPWHVGKDYDLVNIYDERCVYLGGMGGDPEVIGKERKRANAAFVCRAVNNHYALIAALELCLEDAERQSRADAPGVEPDWADDVRAALAAASIKPEGT